MTRITVLLLPVWTSAIGISSADLTAGIADADGQADAKPATRSSAWSRRNDFSNETLRDAVRALTFRRPINACVINEAHCVL